MGRNWFLAQSNDGNYILLVILFVENFVTD